MKFQGKVNNEDINVYLHMIFPSQMYNLFDTVYFSVNKLSPGLSRDRKIVAFFPGSITRLKIIMFEVAMCLN